MQQEMVGTGNEPPGARRTLPYEHDKIRVDTPTEGSRSPVRSRNRGPRKEPLKGKLAVLAVLVAGWGGVTSEAEAAPIRECADAGSFGGAVRIYNVTSRVLLCPRARRFARRYFRHGGPACREDRYCTYRGWALQERRFPGGDRLPLHQHGRPGPAIPAWPGLTPDSFSQPSRTPRYCAARAFEVAGDFPGHLGVRAWHVQIPDPALGGNAGPVCPAQYSP